ncbi:MAG: DUF4384 domain-containing protein [Bryobacterales bacterium]|nr:DUF4384 domain-containing protein [Bryobacterales bacterium]
MTIRYNVLLRQNDREVAVSPTNEFQANDCIVLALESNSPGFLYIVAEGASGKWVSLFPVPNDARTPTRVKAHERVRSPEKGCFEFYGQRGTERFFVAMTREEADVKDIVQAFRLSSVATVPGTPAKTTEEEIAQLGTRLQSRDLRVRTEEEARSDGEGPHTVYAAAPHGRMFLEIRLDHK